jgi:hypothetical protein
MGRQVYPVVFAEARISGVEDPVENNNSKFQPVGATNQGPRSYYGDPAKP